MKIYKVYYNDYYAIKRVSYFKDLPTLYDNFSVCFGVLQSTLDITKQDFLDNIIEIVNTNIPTRITIELMEI